MPDWRVIIRQRLAGLEICPMDEIDIVEELAQHVEDRYDDLRRAGATEDQALAAGLDELDGQTLSDELLDSLTRKS
jgi:putative ABC transport system permease protein